MMDDYKETPSDTFLDMQQDCMHKTCENPIDVKHKRRLGTNPIPGHRAITNW